MANGEVLVRVKAVTAQFSRSMQNSRNEAEKFDKSGTKAAKAGKKVGNEFKKSGKEVNRWTKTMRQASDASALLTGPLGGIASRLTILGKVTSVSTAAMLAFGLTTGAITLGLGAAVREAEKFERSGFKVAAVLKATGNSAGFTAEQIRNMSSEIALATLASVEGVEAAATKLLTFKSVQNDVFTDALRLSQDLAEVGFGSVEAGAVQLGKALEDPVAGLTALKRIGVTFSESQKQVIKSLTESGRLYEAQRIIIETLNEQVGGAGVAAAQGLAGALDTLGQRVSEFLQGVGNSGPLKEFTKLVNLAAEQVNLFNQVMFDTPDERIGELVQERRKLQEGVSGFFPTRGRFETDFITKAAQERINAIDAELKALTRKKNVEREAQEGAKKSADAAAKATAAERKRAVAIKAAQEEADRLRKARIAAFRSVRSEITSLESINAQYKAGTISLLDLANAQDKANQLAKLGLDINSEQGQSLSMLLDQRNKLTRSIEAETASREFTQASNARLQAIETEIAASKILSAAIGKGEDVMRDAEGAAASYRLEQELIAEAIKTQGFLTAEQAEEISRVADEYGRATTRLAGVTAAQEQAAEAAEQHKDRVEDLQSTMVDGFSDMIFSADSLTESFKQMILQMSQAIVKAELLAAVQGKGGTGQSVLGGLFSGFFGGAAAGGSALPGGLSSVQASRLHKGNLDGGRGMPISVPASNFIGAPKFHNGLKPDEFPAILQEGEAVVPKDEVGGMGRRGPSTVNVNITTPDADSFRKSKRQISRQMKQGTAKS